MYTLEKIDKHLVSSDSTSLKGNFVAIAVKIDDTGEATHSGIIIKIEATYLLFHFYGKMKLEDTPKGKWYFHKNIHFISSKLIGSFLAHCTLISKEANPTYGYFYPGSFYKTDGKYFSENKDPEFMTCVGFCINVILGFIEADEYFLYKEWLESDVDPIYAQGTLDKCKEYYPEINLEQFKKHIRRISPTEYIASAYLPDLPITKAAIDGIIDNVNEVIKKRRSPMLPAPDTNVSEIQ